MSCILYSKLSYDLLAHCQIVEEFRRESVVSQYPTARDFTDALFELNLRAYCDRYDADIEAERAEAETDCRPDFDFSNLLAAERAGSGALCAAEIFTLLCRIEYQCSDAHDFQKNEVAWRLGWFKDFAARRMAEHIKATVKQSAAVV